MSEINLFSNLYPGIDQEFKWAFISESNGNVVLYSFVNDPVLFILQIIRAGVSKETLIEYRNPNIDVLGIMKPFRSSIEAIESGLGKSFFLSDTDHMPIEVTECNFEFNGAEYCIWHENFFFASSPTKSSLFDSIKYLLSLEFDLVKVFSLNTLLFFTTHALIKKYDSSNILEISQDGFPNMLNFIHVPKERLA